jgi:hypothetical protein
MRRAIGGHAMGDTWPCDGRYLAMRWTIPGHAMDDTWPCDGRYLAMRCTTPRDRVRRSVEDVSDTMRCGGRHVAMRWAIPHGHARRSVEDVSDTMRCGGRHVAMRWATCRDEMRDSGPAMQGDMGTRRVIPGHATHRYRRVLRVNPLRKRARPRGVVSDTSPLGVSDRSCT